VRSNTFLKEVDKMIADLVLDDEELARAHAEIDSTNQVLGQF